VSKKVGQRGREKKMEDRGREREREIEREKSLDNETKNV
jgi:hypothetical protein